MQHEPSATQPGLLKYTARDIRKSLRLLTVSWPFGAAFRAIMDGAAYTAFLTTYLPINDTSFGLIRAAGWAAVIFLVLGSYVVERTGHAKRYVIGIASAERYLWLIVAAIALLPASQHVGLKSWLIAIVAFTSCALGSFGGVGWHVWVSGIVPRAIAGSFFGLRSRWGIVSMVLTSLGVGVLLHFYGGAGWAYALLFGLAAVMGTVEFLLWLPIPEIPQPVDPHPPTLVSVLTLPWRHPYFRKYASFYGCYAFAVAMMGPFIWRYCFDSRQHHGLGMSPFTAQLVLVIIPWIMMAMTASFWGKAIDRHGLKPVIVVSSLGLTLVSALWIVTHPGILWLPWLIAVLSGLFMPGYEQVLEYLLLKGFPAERRASYNAGLHLVTGIAGMVGVVCGGLLAQYWQHQLPEIAWLPAWVSHYHPLFLASVLLRVAISALLAPALPARACPR